MNPKSILLVCLLISTPALAQTLTEAAEAVPWWKQVDETQGLLLKWITMLTMVATALIGSVVTVYALFKNKIRELTERQDRLGEQKRDLQTQINQVALATDTSKSNSPARVEVVNPPSNPVPTTETKP